MKHLIALLIIVAFILGGYLGKRYGCDKPKLIIDNPNFGVIVDPPQIYYYIGSKKFSIKKGDYIYWRFKNSSLQQEYYCQGVYNISIQDGKVFLQLGNNAYMTRTYDARALEFYKKTP